jgi:lipid A 3-O-deacylase
LAGLLFFLLYEKVGIRRVIECVLFLFKVVFFIKMKLKYTVLTLFFTTLFSVNLIVAEVSAAETISEERYNKVCRWGILNPPECKKKIVKTRKNNNDEPVNSSTKTTQPKTNSGSNDPDCRWGIFNPPKCRGKDSRYNEATKNKATKNNSYIKKEARSFEEESHNISVYTGSFDVKDEVNDDKTSLVGIEHKNKDLFRDTWIGRFSPTTGAFVTGKSSAYLYTGVEADYSLGRITISPSFAPGYYEAGDGKNLGSVLEFKSEVKVGLNLFKNSKLGYSYSHISNNDWGDVNPGSDNQSIVFSQKF